MFGVFRVFKCSRVMTFRKNQKGDQGQNFGWGENSRFWASSSAKKVLLTTEKMGSGQNCRKKILKKAAQKWPKMNMG